MEKDPVPDQFSVAAMYMSSGSMSEFRLRAAVKGVARAAVVIVHYYHFRRTHPYVSIFLKGVFAGTVWALTAELAALAGVPSLFAYLLGGLVTSTVRVLVAAVEEAYCGLLEFLDEWGPNAYRDKAIVLSYKKWPALRGVLCRALLAWLRKRPS